MGNIIHAWLILVLVALWPGMAQAKLITHSVDFVFWTESLLPQAENQDRLIFVPPRQPDIDAFRTTVHTLLQERWAEAHNAAVQMNYTVLRLTDTGWHGDVFYALVPAADNTDGRSYFVVRPMNTRTRNLVVQVPHPHHDDHTLILGSQMFRALGARALAFASVPRCANLTRPSACDGLTRACDKGSHRFRESDLAHANRSFFHAFHRILEHASPGQPTFLQVHGFSSGPGDPAFIVSDGTTIDQPSSGYITNALALVLETRLAAAGFRNRGYSCNRPGDPDRLCGTTNIQGRFTNGITTDACTVAAHAASGRFIHLELSMALRHPDNPGYAQMIIDAIRTVLP